MPVTGHDYNCKDCGRITSWKELANNGYLCNQCKRKQQ